MNICLINLSEARNFCIHLKGSPLLTTNDSFIFGQVSSTCQIPVQRVRVQKHVNFILTQEHIPQEW